MGQQEGTIVYLRKELFLETTRIGVRHLSDFNAGVQERSFEVLMMGFRVLLLPLHHHFCIYIF
jgi:hypothetical protein